MAAPFRNCSRLAANLRSKLPSVVNGIHSNHGECLRNQLSAGISVKRAGSTFCFYNQRTFTLSQTNVNRRQYSTTSERTCWKCGNKVDNNEELFFCKCGVVQDIKGLTFFELMGIPESFDIDVTSLTQKYRDLQRQLHPDKYTLKSEREKQIAEEQSSCVNKAYFTLLKPLPRAQYLLERRGVPIEEDNSEADQAFLMEIMEVNEDIMDADTPDALQPIQMSNDLNIKNCVSEISKAFSNNNIDKAKELTIRLKYFNNINDKIIGIYQKHFGAQ